MSYYHLGQIFYKQIISVTRSRCSSTLSSWIRITTRPITFWGLFSGSRVTMNGLSRNSICTKSDELKVKCFLAKGSCFLERSQYPKAAMEFEKGLKFARSGSETALNLRYYLAESQEKMRDVHSAIRNWELIAEVNKNFRMSRISSDSSPSSGRTTE